MSHFRHVACKVDFYLIGSKNRPMSHVGNLNLDAPGLVSALKMALPPEFVDLLGGVYAAAADLDGLVENPIKRGELDSFNPRPARVCQILLKEAKENDPVVLAAAMLSCASSLPVDELIGGSYALVNLSKKFPTESSLASSRVVLALLIDQLRHVHMSSISRDEIDGIVKRAEQILSTRRDIENARLIKIAEVAIVNVKGLMELKETNCQSKTIINAKEG